MDTADLLAQGYREAMFQKGDKFLSISKEAVSKHIKFYNGEDGYDDDSGTAQGNGMDLSWCKETSPHLPSTDGSSINIHEYERIDYLQTCKSLDFGQTPCFQNQDQEYRFVRNAYGGLGDMNQRQGRGFPGQAPRPRPAPARRVKEHDKPGVILWKRGNSGQQTKHLLIICTSKESSEVYQELKACLQQF